MSTALEMTSSNWTAIVGRSGDLEESAIHVSLVVFLKSYKRTVGIKWLLVKDYFEKHLSNDGQSTCYSVAIIFTIRAVIISILFNDSVKS